MASANITHVTAAFRQIYGRQPTSAEIQKYSNMEQGDPRYVDIFEKLKSQLKAEGDPNPVVRAQSSAAREAAAVNGGVVQSQQQFPQQGFSATGVQPTPSISPSFFSGGATINPSNGYSSSPAFQQLSARQYGGGQTFSPTVGASAPSGFEGYKPTSATPTGAQVQPMASKPRSDGTTLEGGLADVQSYLEELNSQARGDYDFVIKYLDSQHKMALGTNDVARAQFFEAVADKLETNIGRIPFDYLQKTDRERENLGNIFRRNDIAQKQLKLQEDQFNEQQAFKAEQDNNKIKEEFSARGMIDSGIQKSEQNKAELARRVFEQNPFMTEQDVRRQQLGQSLSEDILGSNRRIEDITVDSRRNAQDFIFGQDKTREGAQVDLTKQLTENQQRAAASERAVRSAYDETRLNSIMGGGI